MKTIQKLILSTVLTMSIVPAAIAGSSDTQSNGLFFGISQKTQVTLSADGRTSVSGYDLQVGKYGHVDKNEWGGEFKINHLFGRVEPLGRADFLHFKDMNSSFFSIRPVTVFAPLVSGGSREASPLDAGSPAKTILSGGIGFLETQHDRVNAATSFIPARISAELSNESQSVPVILKLIGSVGLGTVVNKTFQNETIQMLAYEAAASADFKLGEYTRLVATAEYNGSKYFSKSLDSGMVPASFFPSSSVGNLSGRLTLKIAN